MYSSELQSGVCKGGGASPEIVRQTVATALVEGHNLMGEYMYPQLPPTLKKKTKQKQNTPAYSYLYGKLVYVECIISFEGTMYMYVHVVRYEHENQLSVNVSSHQATIRGPRCSLTPS